MSFASTLIDSPPTPLLASLSMGSSTDSSSGPLRRRMQVLHHASLNSDSVPNSNGKENGHDELRSRNGIFHHGHDDHEFVSQTEYETGSASSEEDGEQEQGLDESKSSPASPASGSRRPSREFKREPSSPHSIPPRSPAQESSRHARSTRAWYEFDLSVVVALVSPIGNWLTGGDHVKNLLLILLLIFYLHQIIEIPWNLYHATRPRRRPQNTDGDQTPQGRHQKLAASELRNLELLFLGLTVLSPFLGAAILRQVAIAVAGKDVISWFSIGLFVLATGIRPWRHLIERLNDRTVELHDVVHYPPAPNVGDHIQSQLEETIVRVAQLEEALAKMRMRIKSTTDEVYEYVDDAVDVLEKSAKRHEKKYEKQEEKMKLVEDHVDALKKARAKAIMKETAKLNTNLQSFNRSHHSLFSLILPSWLFSTPTHTTYQSQSPLSSAPVSKYSLRSYPSSPRLETIHEEMPLPNPPQEPSSLLRIPGVNLALRWGDLATLPLRTVLGYLIVKP